MSLETICNNIAKQFNFESIEKLFENNKKIEKINGYDGFYKFPFLTENVICRLTGNNLFVNYSKLHATIGAGIFSKKFVLSKFVNSFNLFLETIGEKTINVKEWNQAKTVKGCLNLIDKKFYLYDPTLNSKSPISGVYLPMSFLHHFLIEFDIKYRTDIAEMINSIGLNALFSTDENKTTENIIQTITTENYEELTKQIKELQLKYEEELDKRIKADQERAKYENESKIANEKYTNYFNEGETIRRAANICDSENRRLLSIIAEKNREIERLEEENANLEKRKNKLTKEINELYKERFNYRAEIDKEKAAEIEGYKNTIKQTNEFVSEIMQFIEPLNKMLKSVTKKNNLINFMTKNNIIMKKTYKVDNPDYDTEYEKYLNKKTKYETQLENIKNIDELKSNMKKEFINAFKTLNEDQQLELIDEEKYNNAIEKARKQKKRIPHKYKFINVSMNQLYMKYPDEFNKYYTLNQLISNLEDEETIQQKLDNLYVPVKYTIHYPKKDIEYKMGNIEVYSHEMQTIIDFIRDKTVYDESPNESE